MTSLLSKATIPLLAILGILAMIVFGISALNTAIDTARADVRAERDAHWQGEISKSNLAAEIKHAEQLNRVILLEAKANAQVADLQDQLTRLEKDNAALPNADACGLDRDRVKLLR